MIQLPSNLTTAALAAILGAGLGLAGGWHLWHTPDGAADKVPLDFSQSGLLSIEKDRSIQDRDTSGQSEPDVEIRYRRDTIHTTDTLRVPVPTDLTDGVVSDRTPIEVTPDRAVWTYYDPEKGRREQRVWKVPEDRYRLSLYGLVQRRWGADLAAQQTSAGIGIQAHLDPKWVPGALRPYAEAHTDLGQVHYTGGIRWVFLSL